MALKREENVGLLLCFTRTGSKHLLLATPKRITSGETERERVASLGFMWGNDYMPGVRNPPPEAFRGRRRGFGSRIGKKSVSPEGRRCATRSHDAVDLRRALLNSLP